MEDVLFNMTLFSFCSIKVSRILDKKTISLSLMNRIEGE